MKRLLIIAVIAALVAAFFGFGWNEYLTLEQLKSSQSTVDQWLSDRPVLIPALYFVIYVVVTALSLPGAAVMTIAGGALFGLWQGLLLVRLQHWRDPRVSGGALSVARLRAAALW